MQSKITEPFFCDASYNHIGKLGTLMVAVCVMANKIPAYPYVPYSSPYTDYYPYPSQYLPLPLLLPLLLPLPTTMGAPSISGRVGPG